MPPEVQDMYDEMEILNKAIAKSLYFSKKNIDLQNQCAQ